MTQKNLHSDIAIVGGGIIGMCAALAAARTGASITIIDASAPQAQVAPDFDGRASAIAASSYRMLTALGVTQRFTAPSGPILDILISDGEAGQTPSPLTLHFDSRLNSEDGIAAPMGYMVENRHMRAALMDAISDTPNISWHAPARVSASEAGSLTFDDASVLTAKLVIAADGAQSQLRRGAGIDVTGWEYGQAGIVTTVSHDLPHDGVAHELFLPAGPFAILPLADDPDGTHRSSIVWTDSLRAAQAAMALPDALFEAELARRFGDFLGAVKVIAPRWSYPLGLQIAKNYTAERLLLIGDAAHRIHPIAGQGLNMGLRDVAALADVLMEAHEGGQDFGGAQTLMRYAQWRRFDNHLLAGATDIFNRLFSNSIAPLQHARRLGLAAVDKIAPARKFFMKEASGETGDLPSLMR